MYTRGELVLLLARQLFLLREALVRTVAHPTYYPDLFRTLRVLIIDGNRGRLGHLARDMDISHTVPSMFSNVPPGELLSSKRGPDPLRNLRLGMQGMMFVNPCSRWLKLRGIEIEPPLPCLETDFWIYLEEEIVSNKAAYGSPVSRATLIAETANTRDVVHASLNYPTFLRGATGFGATGPYFIELAQEVGLEVLSYGETVLAAARERYRDEIATAVQDALPIPAHLCDRCGLPLAALDEFQCGRCGHAMLPRAQRPRLIERLSSFFHYGGATDEPEGTVVINLDVSIIHANPLTEIPLVDVSGTVSSMTLVRTGKGELIWEVKTEFGTRKAVWRAQDSPKAGNVMFFFFWTRDKISITSQTLSGNLLDVASDGESRVVDDSDSSSEER